MSTPETAGPQDPQQLKDEIVRTRAELAGTVEALAAKTDVKARAKHAAADTLDTAKQRLAGAVEQTRQTVGDAAAATAEKAGAAAGAAAGAVAGTAEAAAASVRDTVRHIDVPVTVRRPLPWALIGAAVAVTGVVVYVTRRRRA